MESDKLFEDFLPHFDDPAVAKLIAMGVDNISKVRNKLKRQELFKDSKIAKAKKKLAERKERAQAEKLNPKLKEVVVLE